MSVLIYKQRHRHPNRKDTPKANYAHVRYIATRPGVIKNAECEHGLFGKLQPGDITEFADWREVAKLVYTNSQKRIVMYRSVISFSGETAKELRLTEQKSWQRYIENHIMTIAEKNGIRRETLQWAAAVHGERAHPHMHVIFWDTSVKVRNPFTPPQIPNAIRRQLIRDTFAAQILAFARQKSMAAKELRQITDTMVEQFEEEMRIRKLNGLKKVWKYAERAVHGDEMPDRRLLMELADRLFVLRASMPRQGRIAYQLLPAEAKLKTDELVCFLKKIPELRSVYQAYVEARCHMTELYASDETWLTEQRKAFEKEADQMLANRILSGVRTIIRLEKEMHREDYLSRKREYIASRMILEAMDMLAQAAWNQEEMPDRQMTIGELSKEAKKELILKKQDKGYEY